MPGLLFHLQALPRLTAPLATGPSKSLLAPDLQITLYCNPTQERS